MLVTIRKPELVDIESGEHVSPDGLIIEVDGRVIAAVDEYGTARLPGMKASESIKDNRDEFDMDQLCHLAGVIYARHHRAA